MHKNKNRKASHLSPYGFTIFSPRLFTAGISMPDFPALVKSFFCESLRIFLKDPLGQSASLRPACPAFN
ncbi:MAG: hypothetical protein A3G91_05540 [Omnitrophica WOR_2 bacterium RIFCSPLOWO2_12_FULL_50_9]|nr:MAG: hypothetical protein A3D87_09255 [Omnitrophica WOR_2 bacterium RIFCSPHIGHO2_02_FULL_50_17]OGX41761.1 MAG: hypothetical protein A3G91_05540 [Omnitrophica WOR_2 bacterium RIFCSPLOWO2_12_FULL_50_9]